MNITVFQFKDGRLIYGDDNFVYFEPQPRFTINRNNKMLVISVGDEETSVELVQVYKLLGLTSIEECIQHFYDNYFSSIKDAARLDGQLVTDFLTDEDEQIVRNAFANLQSKIIL